MPFNKELAIRIKASLNTFSEEFTEKKIFGGIVFYIIKKMTNDNYK